MLLRSIEIKPWFLRFVLYEHFSSSLSLARSLWVTEVDEPHNRPPAMLGHGSAVRDSILGHGSAARKNMLGHGSAARKICWVTEVQHQKNMLGHGRPPRLASAPLLSRQVPAGLFGVLCSSVPQSDFHSHPQKSCQT